MLVHFRPGREETPSPKRVAVAFHGSAKKLVVNHCESPCGERF
ncbi:MAG: hypothetical protein PVJ19_19175 [Desulfobacteraceae bacterium]